MINASFIPTEKRFNPPFNKTHGQNFPLASIQDENAWPGESAQSKGLHPPV
jgi:hypothetical protein